MNYKQYKYEQFTVQRDDSLLFSLKINDYKDTTPEQINLFSLMINFGYTPISSNQLIFTDEQIINFWNYGKSTVLKTIKLNQYYKDLGIAPVFTAKIPTLKTTGAFFSDQYEIIVTWINDVSSGKIASSPQSYKRNGLELFGIDNEIKGSLTPEYFYLYQIVDKVNSNWPKMTKTEKYNFLVELSTISNKTKFLMPPNLASTLTDLQSK